MYFKMLNSDLSYNGFQYKEGLNINPSFNEHTQSCEGEMYFSSERDIIDFSVPNGKIALVEVPPQAKMVHCHHKIKANALILSDIRDLWTVDTFQYLLQQGVDIRGNDYPLRIAAMCGYMDVLKFLIEHGGCVRAYNDAAIYLAAYNGQTEVVKYLIDVIKYASSS